MAVFDITDFGAVGDGLTNSRTQINNCLSAAAAAGGEVFIPAGTFLHNGTLTAPNGVRRIFGVGETSKLKATAYGQEALIMSGDNWTLINFHLEGVGGARLTTDNSQKVLMNQCDGFNILHMKLSNTTTGGFKMNACSNGRIAFNTVENTHADSIHMTIGPSGSVSHNILVEHNTVRFSGDDGIAVVSYGTVNGNPNHDIIIRNNDVRFNTNGRGIGIIGCENVLIVDNVVHGGTSDKAGIYIASEGNQYDTTPVDNVCVAGNFLEDCGSEGPTGHGSIFVYNSQEQGATHVSGVKIANNTISNSRNAAIKAFGSFPIHMNYYGNTVIGGATLFVDANNHGSSTFSTTPVNGCPRNIYHFANDGNDTTGNGSQAAPYATTSKANSIVAEGDTLRFKRGHTFTGATLVPTNAVTIDDWGAGELPTHNHGSSVGINFPTASRGIHVINQRFVGGGTQIKTGTGGTHDPNRAGGGHKVLGCTFFNYGQNGGLGIHLQGGTDFEVGDCQFTLNNQADHILGTFHNVWLHDTDFNSPGPPNGDQVQFFWSHDILVEDCTFEGVATGKGNFISTAHLTAPTDPIVIPINTIVRRCTFDGGNFGIASNSRDIHVHDCTFTNIGNQPGATTWAAAIWMSVDFNVQDIGVSGLNVHNNFFNNCARVVHGFPTSTPQRAFRLDFYDNTVCVGDTGNPWMSLNGTADYTGDVSNNIIKDSTRAAHGCSPADLSGMSIHDNFYENTTQGYTLCGSNVNESGAVTGDAELDGSCCPNPLGAASGYGVQECEAGPGLIEGEGQIQSQSATLSNATLSITGEGPVASENSLFAFSPQDHEPATTSALPFKRNLHPIVVFSGTVDQEVTFSKVIPNQYGGNGITVSLLIQFTSATSGTSRWQVSWEKLDTDADADSFATAKSVALTAHATAGVPQWVDIAFLHSEIDGLTGGDPFRLKIRRDADGTSGTDDITTTAELRMVKAKET